jgi:hypothetical protein
MADICHTPSDLGWSEIQKHLGGEPECGKWPLLGKGFGATMNTIRIRVRVVNRLDGRLVTFPLLRVPVDHYASYLLASPTIKLTIIPRLEVRTAFGEVHVILI